MKKYLTIIVAALFLLVNGVLFSNQDNSSNTTSSPNTAQTQSYSTKQSRKQDAQNTFDIADLTHTDYFNPHALEHIFYGTINRKGDATGFHYEGVAPEAEIIDNTRTKNDKNGVYRAEVKIENIKKRAVSSFFPEDWQPQDVVDAINEAYDNKEHVNANVYEGTSHNITIQMYLTDDNKIISAFPIYNKR